MLQRIRAKLLDELRHLFCLIGKLAAHGRRQVVETNSLRFQADFFQKMLYSFNSSFCVYITFQVMAVSRQSTSYHHTIYAGFKRLQHQQGIQLAGAG
jgi:hypothetical protein